MKETEEKPKSWIEEAWEYSRMAIENDLPTTIDGMNPKQWMDYMFDHTVVLANDDPEKEQFKELDARGVIQLRLLDGPVGAERFAEFLYHKLNDFVQQETLGRVKIARVEFFENKRNSAIYEG